MLVEITTIRDLAKVNVYSTFTNRRKMALKSGIKFSYLPISRAYTKN